MEVVTFQEIRRVGEILMGTERKGYYSQKEQHKQRPRVRVRLVFGIVEALGLVQQRV